MSLLPKSNSARWLLGFAFVVALLAIASVSVAIANKRDVVLFPKETPEGTVQDYLLALQAGDETSAYDHFSDDLKRQCPQQEFLEEVEMSDFMDSRLTLEDVITDGDDATVVIRVNSTFGSGDETRFVLHREDGGSWKLTEPPWPVGGCPYWKSEGPGEFEEPPFREPADR
jgi:hypothetical protein